MSTSSFDLRSATGRSSRMPADADTSAPASAAPSIQASSERRRFGRLLIFGVLWSLIIIALEVPNVGYELSRQQLVLLIAHQLLFWVPSGIAFAIAVYWSTIGRVRWLRLVCSMLLANLVAQLSSIGYPALENVLFGEPPMEWLVGKEFPIVPAMIYTSWIGLAYGGLAAVLYALRRNIDLTTASLHHTALARERNESAIADARVQALVERIEPQFLLDVMDAARRLYRDRPDEAETTLNACVAFLRSTMPQVRSGVSSVGTELDAAGDYLRLRDCVRGTAPQWRIERSPEACALDLSCVPMPPMSLLPALDRIAPALQDAIDGQPLVIITVTSDGAVVTIELRSPHADGDDDTLHSEWLDALDLRLALVCGRASTSTSQRIDVDQRIFRITVPATRRHASSIDGPPTWRSA